MSFFTHSVDGKVFGAWYRVLSCSEIEVLTIGLLETKPYCGADPEKVARATLEQFVQQRAAQGMQIPALDEIKSSTSDS